MSAVTVTSPTAQALVRDVAVTPNRRLLGLKLGLFTWLHWVPSQWRMRPCCGLAKSPTAQTSLFDTARTALSSPEVTAVFCCVQALPSQCRMRGWTPLPLSKLPTAQMLTGDTACTPSSVLDTPKEGIGVTVQVAPFQCSIRA